MKVGDEVVFTDSTKQHYFMMFGSLRLRTGYLIYALDCIRLNVPLIVTAIDYVTIQINNKYWYVKSRFNLKLDKSSNNGKVRFTYIISNDYIEFNGFNRWSKDWK